jgi:hypothetical protein
VSLSIGSGLTGSVTVAVQPSETQFLSGKLRHERVLGVCQLSLAASGRSYHNHEPLLLGVLDVLGGTEVLGVTGHLRPLSRVRSLKKYEMHRRHGHTMCFRSGHLP